MTAQPDEILLLRPEEAARRLGIGRATMYKLISDRSIRSIKIRGLRKIRPEALTEYIESLDSRP